VSLAWWCCSADPIRVGCRMVVSAVRIAGRSRGLGATWRSRQIGRKHTEACVVGRRSAATGFESRPGWAWCPAAACYLGAQALEFKSGEFRGRSDGDQYGPGHGPLRIALRRCSAPGGVWSELKKDVAGSSQPLLGGSAGGVGPASVRKGVQRDRNRNTERQGRQEGCGAQERSRQRGRDDVGGRA